MNDINIRQGTIRDVNRVSRLWFDAIKEANPDSNPNIDWWRAFVNLFLQQNPDFHLWVLEIDGMIHGFCNFFMIAEPLTGQVHAIGQNIYISPEYRNTKAVFLLYKTFLKDVKSLGATVIDISCSIDGYEREMFKRKGYKEVEVKLRKQL